MFYCSGRIHLPASGSCKALREERLAAAFHAVLPVKEDGDPATCTASAPRLCRHRNAQKGPSALPGNAFSGIRKLWAPAFLLPQPVILHRTRVHACGCVQRLRPASGTGSFGGAGGSGVQNTKSQPCRRDDGQPGHEGGHLLRAGTVLNRLKLKPSLVEAGG